MKVLFVLLLALVCVYGSVAPCTELSIWNKSTPTLASYITGDQPVTLGLRFYSEVNGTVTSVSFYVNAADNQTWHGVAVWDNNGVVRGQQPLVNGNGATGWVTIRLFESVIIPAYTVWTVGVRAYVGQYTYQHDYFTGAPTVDNSPLHGVSGVYTYGRFQGGNEVPFVGDIPNLTYQGTNYWVDVGFTPSAPCPSFSPCV